MLRLDLERCPYVVADSSRPLALSTLSSRCPAAKQTLERIGILTHNIQHIDVVVELFQL
jgi:hypothetical protein